GSVLSEYLVQDWQQLPQKSHARVDLDGGRTLSRADDVELVQHGAAGEGPAGLVRGLPAAGGEPRPEDPQLRRALAGVVAGGQGLPGGGAGGAGGGDGAPDRMAGQLVAGGAVTVLGLVYDHAGGLSRQEHDEHLFAGGGVGEGAAVVGDGPADAERLGVLLV